MNLRRLRRRCLLAAAALFNEPAPPPAALFICVGGGVEYLTIRGFFYTKKGIDLGRSCSFQAGFIDRLILVMNLFV